jgi:hypothetical protein
MGPCKLTLMPDKRANGSTNDFWVVGLGKSKGSDNAPLGFSWWRGLDLNQRPPGYEPDELPLLYPASNTHSIGFVLSLA